MALYGLYGFTHGWAQVLNVMDERLDLDIARRVVANEGIDIHDSAGPILRVYEKRSGALAAFIEANEVRIVEREEWDRVKAEAKREDKTGH